MKKILPFLVLSLGLCAPVAVLAQAAPASAVTVEVGHPVIDVEGKRIGVVYRVGDDGAAQVVVDGKLYSVPAATLTASDDKLITSLKKKDVLSKH